VHGRIACDLARVWKANKDSFGEGGTTEGEVELGDANIVEEF